MVSNWSRRWGRSSCSAVARRCSSCPAGTSNFPVVMAFAVRAMMARRSAFAVSRSLAYTPWYLSRHRSARVVTSSWDNPWLNR